MNNKEGNISSLKTELVIAVLHMIESDIPTYGMQ